jgi:Pro-kumamolisin, activation domain
VRTWLGFALLAAVLATATPASADVTFYFGLERPESAARSAWTGVGDPASSSYRQFRLAAAVARRYGASASTVRRLRRALVVRGFGVQVDPSHVFARVAGTVRRFERLLRVRIRK